MYKINLLSIGLVSDDDDDDENISPRIEEHTKINLLSKNADSGDADSTKDAVDTDDAVEADFANYILKCKSVYKCKLCPRIMCLNEEMVRVHLKSKVTNCEEKSEKFWKKIDKKYLVQRVKAVIITCLHFSLSIVEACSIQETIR